MSTESPKRKRDQYPPPISTRISEYPQLQSDVVTSEDASPGTKVTGKFRRLALGNEPTDMEADGDLVSRKRQRKAVEDEVPSSSPTPLSAEIMRPAANESKVKSAGAGEAENSTDSIVRQHRPSSPTLSGEVNPFYWQDSEITGHDPDDPSDDGYGINGIGFKPTQQQRYHQQQKRRQQLEAYRLRETKDARQRRSERRRTTFADDPSETSTNEQKRVKVHFDDS